MLRPAHGVILAVFALMTVGVLMVNSVGLARNPGLEAAALASAPPAGPVTAAGLLWGRPTLYAALAVAALLVGTAVPIGRLVDAIGRRSLGPWIAGVAAACTLLALASVYVPGLGKEVNGARRWVEIGSWTMQPSEIAKWTMPALIAWWCVTRGDTIDWFRRGFLPAIAWVMIVGGMIGIEDLGTGVLVVGVAVLLLAAGGVRIAHLMLLVPAGLAAVTVAIIESPYRVRRLLAWQDPFADPQGIGYHIIQSLSAIAGGGVSGRGLGQGIQKFGYLPEGTTDFIFANICEELGLAGAVLVVGLFAALLWSGLQIITASSEGRSASPGLRLFGFGVVMTVGLQALMNLLVVTGLAPTKGIALPLVSHGGTGWVLTAFSLGLLASIDRSRRATAQESSTSAPDAVPATT
ncbi:MAG: stage V sporulation protein E [Phycisphaerae bacterium]|nr:stage V sporulation protein E [Phycisphaerae bacterium]